MDQDIKTVIQYPVGATEFDIPFDYLSRKFVRVSLVSDDNRRLLSNITEYRYVSKTRVKLLAATTGFDRVEIRRFTSASERVVDFNDGSVLRANDLNVSQLQSAHIAEEARDSSLMALSENDMGDLDAKGRRIVNLADGRSSTDAVNMGQLDEKLGEATGVLGEILDAEDRIDAAITNFLNSTGSDGDSSFVISATEYTSTIACPEGALDVPRLYVNGTLQYPGLHYVFDYETRTVILAADMHPGDVARVYLTTRVVDFRGELAGPGGAALIGKAGGGTVQSFIDAVK